MKSVDTKLTIPVGHVFRQGPVSRNSKKVLTLLSNLIYARLPLISPRTRLERRAHRPGSIKIKWTGKGTRQRLQSTGAALSIMHRLL